MRLADKLALELLQLDRRIDELEQQNRVLSSRLIREKGKVPVISEEEREEIEQTISNNTALMRQLLIEANQKDKEKYEELLDLGEFSYDDGYSH